MDWRRVLQLMVVKRHRRKKVTAMRKKLEKARKDLEKAQREVDAAAAEEEEDGEETVPTTTRGRAARVIPKRR
jgi:hypothetical protein